MFTRSQVIYKCAHALVNALGHKDDVSKHHSVRVAQVSLMISEQFESGLVDTDTLYLGALCHDIGKIGVPDSILKSTGRLDAECLRIMQRHAVFGADMIESLGIDGTQDIVSIIRHHHESFLGGGYPDGLLGESIPIGARIVSVADYYDALTSSRSYKKAFSQQAALQIMSTERRFDPIVFEAFLNIVSRIS